LQNPSQEWDFKTRTSISIGVTKIEAHSNQQNFGGETSHHIKNSSHFPMVNLDLCCENRKNG